MIGPAAAIAELSASPWKQLIPALDGSPTGRVISASANGTTQRLLAQYPGSIASVEVLTIIPSTRPG